MSEVYIEMIAAALGIRRQQAGNTIKLMEEGGTVPFIARYRKEATGGLDEVQIGEIQMQLARLQEIDKRRSAILKSIEEQGLLTPDLERKIKSVWVMAELEDLYLPYKPKRKTKASIAREKGLEPLAKIIMAQNDNDPAYRAEHFITNEVPDTREALQGARDIIAEWINESATARASVRKVYEQGAIITAKVVKGKEAEGATYRDYFGFEEALKKIPSHRLLALRRGEAEGILRIKISPDENRALDALDRIFLKGDNASTQEVETAITDAYKRLVSPSIESEFQQLSKERADEEAINVFAENLRQLLLSSPLGQKRTMGIDPGYRTGCKVVCLDAQGNLLYNTAIYPHPPQNEAQKAGETLMSLTKKYEIQAIAIGNGTAGRETEAFVNTVFKGRDLSIFMVNESGASIYSASEAAREEFPDQDITVRGSVSIARRLMDPLAELVKIDPKSIGVGQYQHDVDQKKLKESLDRVVEQCVNKVGVNLNTASKQLLSYVAGVGPQLAQNIVDHRKENGPFSARKDLKKVKRLGDKAFEQCAGFLRIPVAKNPLDNTAVHPERYALVEQMAKDAGCKLQDLIKDAELRKKIDLNKYINEEVGLPTLKDIMTELARPGLDPRPALIAFSFADNIHAIADLHEGMVLPGIVTNITNFGAFVDVGVKQDGLVHISQLSDKYVSSPGDVVKLQQQVQVKVIEVDVARKRINLSMKL